MIVSHLVGDVTGRARSCEGAVGSCWKRFGIEHKAAFKNEFALFGRNHLGQWNRTPKLFLNAYQEAPQKLGAFLTVAGQNQGPQNLVSFGQASTYEDV